MQTTLPNIRREHKNLISKQKVTVSEFPIKDTVKFILTMIYDDLDKGKRLAVRQDAKFIRFVVVVFK